MRLARCVVLDPFMAVVENALMLFEWEGSEWSSGRGEVQKRAAGMEMRGCLDAAVLEKHVHDCCLSLAEKALFIQL